MTIFNGIFPGPGADKTRYRLLTKQHVKTRKWNGRTYLFVEPAGLSLLAAEAFSDGSFFLRASYLAQLAAIGKDTGASDNDRFVARALLKNAVIAAEGVLPLCQDTGTATIIAFKGEAVQTGDDDVQALSRGVFKAYTENNLRYSHMAPLSLFDEVNTGCNLPAQIDIASVLGNEYRFLCMAKGGGSSNKTALFQETKALLNKTSFAAFLKEKIKALGVAACPPYHIAVVVGGTSPEMCLKTVKLALTGHLDNLPLKGNKRGSAFRDRFWEKQVLAIARETGLGAQFGGTYLALDARVIRLPRHAGSCPIGLGVSCNADRNIKAKITKQGIFLEALEKNPSRYFASVPFSSAKEPVPVDLNKPMAAILKQLAACPAGTLVSLSGPLIVARDSAHARIKNILDKTGDIPEYFKQHPVYYAGQAKTPKGMISGSFGPTTALRMDAYVPSFMKQGASLVSLAKGNRAATVTEACKTYGGFYLGTIGGAAALIARENIVKTEIIDFADLGMEAIRRITVKDLPAFILINSRGCTA
ncbi:MAG: fumarate hydratase [Candidatus Raymondbacteria bacterium RifOxyB12_full_50_8]|nr:MAG: fumarate hydratase [Candidatus Raymondbacteria bacterium RifOxyB12_full_50_8]